MLPVSFVNSPYSKLSFILATKKLESIKKETPVFVVVSMSTTSQPPRRGHKG